MLSIWKHLAACMLASSVSTSLLLAQSVSHAIFDPNVQATGYYAQLSDGGNTWPPSTGGEGTIETGYATDPIPSETGDLYGDDLMTLSVADEVGGLGCDTGCATDVGSCTGSCESGCSKCCGPWRHCVSVYGGFLYLRPRNADVAYAVPTNGPIVGPPGNNPIEIGRVGVVDPDYAPSYFGGVTYALNACTSLDARYTSFESRTSDSVSIDPPNVIRSLVSHPSALSADNDSLWSRASQGIDFDLIDISFRRLWKSCGLIGVNTVIGARYAHLEQGFHSEHIDNEFENVRTDLDFEGGGIRIGLEADRYSCRNQLHIFARGYGSFVAGDFKGSYLQGRDVDDVIVRADWEGGRVVPILDLEAGLGWTHPCRRFRVGLGYTFSAWFNTVMTEDYIKSVQSSNFTDLGDALTFDGVTADIEWRF